MLADAGWCPELPQRLRSIHSYWLSRKHGVVLFRGRLFSQRVVRYIMQLRDDIPAAEGAPGDGAADAVGGDGLGCGPFRSCALFELPKALVSAQEKVLSLSVISARLYSLLLSCCHIS